MRINYARINTNNIVLIVEINLQKFLNITKIIRAFNKKILTNIVFEKFFANIFDIIIFKNNLKKFFANVFVTLFFNFSIENIFIIVFNVDFNKNVDIDYNFRD